MDVCTLDTGTKVWTCDVSTAGGASSVVVVEDYDTSGSDDHYEAWGDYDGELFCCQVTDDDDVDEVKVVGSNYSDTLRFSWDSLTYNLQAVSGEAALDAEIKGGTGMDSIYGSDSSSGIVEVLFGEGGADTIRAYDGDDELHGGPEDDAMFGDNGDDYLDGAEGDDSMYGGNGEDDMYGYGGNDIMLGGGGDDDMEGGDGNDQMSGGSGGDYMTGQSGSDFICGDSSGVNADLLFDSDYDSETIPDQLWDEDTSSSDTISCWDSSTDFGGSGIYTIGACGASATLSSRPSLCP
jgi:Ca2+-binding RTX toxin-like protein